MLTKWHAITLAVAVVSIALPKYLLAEGETRVLTLVQEVEGPLDFLRESLKCPLKPSEDKTNCECDACYYVHTVTTKSYTGDAATMRIVGNSFQTHLWEVNAVVSTQERQFSYAGKYKDFGSVALSSDSKLTIRCSANKSCVEHYIKWRWKTRERGVIQAYENQNGEMVSVQKEFPVCDRGCMGELVEEKRLLPFMTLTFCNQELATYAKEAIEELIQLNAGSVSTSKSSTTSRPTPKTDAPVSSKKDLYKNNGLIPLNPIR